MIRTTAALGDARFFAHEAMMTTFTLRFASLPENEARGVARECFELIDRLEESLSRFREGGEVWMINHLSAGQTLYLSDACHRCLLKAMEAYEATGGLFDITLGRRIQHQKDGLDGPLPAVTGNIVVHPDVAAVTCGEAGRELDLGGIGKGFALDEVAGLLRDWDVTDVLVAAGASSMLAVGNAGWPIDLAGGGGTERIFLSDCGLSASGTGVQGRHIFHPGIPDGATMPDRQRVWVMAPTATSAEVWSTAVMLVPDGELGEWLAAGGDFQRVFVDGVNGLKRVFGEGAL